MLEIATPGQLSRKRPLNDNGGLVAAVAIA